jgi:ferritin-like metal-binding protein YciE
MSYCRFRNTLDDLRDCYDHLGDSLKGEEKEAMEKLVELCKEIASDFGD